jgi:hypothetical protein
MWMLDLFREKLKWRSELSCSIHHRTALGLASASVRVTPAVGHFELMLSLLSESRS